VSVARLRPLAQDDLAERTRYYRADGGNHLGVRFFEAAVSSLRAIETMPNAGSPRVANSATFRGFESAEFRGFRSVGSTSSGRTTPTSFVSCPTPKTCPSSWPISTPTEIRRTSHSIVSAIGHHADSLRLRTHRVRRRQRHLTLLHPAACPMPSNVMTGCVATAFIGDMDFDTGFGARWQPSIEVIRSEPPTPWPAP